MKIVHQNVAGLDVPHCLIKNLTKGKNVGSEKNVTLARQRRAAEGSYDESAQ